MAEQMFGTDGARGAYDETQTPGNINEVTFGELAYQHATLAAERYGETPIIVVGGDTRPSAPGLLAAVSQGAERAGAEVWNLGVAPTPAIAWVARERRAAAIAVTASHNPAKDNGFKAFDVGGVKLEREVLDEIETRYWQTVEDGQHSPAGRSGRVLDQRNITDLYLSHLVNQLGGEGTLDGKLVVIDGANGATHNMTPQLFQALGATVVEFACGLDSPINQGVGAAHLEGLQAFLQQNPELTKEPGFIGAFANDGDGDRVMGVDRYGRIADGNHWMDMLADNRQKGIVGTLYTNTGLREQVTGRGVDFHPCDNGDSYVTAKLHALTAEHGAGYTRGGEFTGHLIDTEHLPSGDGLYMAGRMVVNLANRGLTLADTYDSLQLWPERMRGIDVTGYNGKAIAASEQVQTTKTALEETHGEDARIVLRASGTEPKVRAWVEARQAAIADMIANQLEAAVRSALK